MRRLDTSRAVAQPEESKPPEKPPALVKGNIVNSPTTTLTAHRDQQDNSQARNKQGKLRLRSHLTGGEAGMATAEYAIATLAAVGLAGLLVVLLRSDEVRGFLLNLIRTALSLP